MNRELFENFITQYPIYQYHFFMPEEITFTERVRIICKQECDRYGATWACPPAVGSVEECKNRCLSYSEGFFFSSVAEVSDIMDLKELLETRKYHETVVTELEEFLNQQGIDCYALSTESCDICEKCTYPDASCRFPDQMHPCVESHGIVVTELAEKFEMDYSIGMNQILWFGIIFIK